MKTKPLFAGVKVYVPSATPLKENSPFASAVAVAPPVRVSVAPLASAAGAIAPLTVTGVATMVWALAPAPLTVTTWLAGVSEKPLFAAETV